MDASVTLTAFWETVSLPVRGLLVPAFTAWGAAVSWLEIVAFLLSLWMVLCNLRVRMAAWPLAMISSWLYGVLFAHYRLYGEASLQGLFIALAAWGWWQWRFGQDEGARPLAVRPMSRSGRWNAVLAVALLWPALGLLLDHGTDSDVPWLDALPTAGSVVGQWLLARKHVENWPCWLIVNVVSVGLFAWKALWLTAVLYALFAALSWVGWQAWRRMSVEAAS